LTIKCSCGRRVLRYKTSPDDADKDSSSSLRERNSSSSANCWGVRDLNWLFNSTISSSSSSSSSRSYNEAVWQPTNIIRRTIILKESFTYIYLCILLTK
jgi:hypothetical protein